MRALMEEHRSIHEDEPSLDVLELATLSGAEKTEQYEIVAYTGLARMAKDLGESEAARLPRENHEQEKAMARRVADLTKAVSRDVKTARKEADAGAALSTILDAAMSPRRTLAGRAASCVFAVSYSIGATDVSLASGSCWIPFVASIEPRSNTWMPRFWRVVT